MTDRQFTHPDIGNAVRVEVVDNELRLTFVCRSNAKANDAADSMLAQLKEGTLNITLMGKPTSVTEEDL